MHDERGTLFVDLDDVEVMPRHTLVFAVDHQALVARTADAGRQQAGMQAERALAAGQRRGDVEDHRGPRHHDGRERRRWRGRQAGRVGRRRCRCPCRLRDRCDSRAARGRSAGQRNPRVLVRRPLGTRRQHQAVTFAQRQRRIGIASSIALNIAVGTAFALQRPRGLAIVALHAQAVGRAGISRPPAVLLQPQLGMAPACIGAVDAQVAARLAMPKVEICTIFAVLKSIRGPPQSSGPRVPSQCARRLRRREMRGRRAASPTTVGMPR